MNDLKRERSSPFPASAGECAAKCFRLRDDAKLYLIRPDGGRAMSLPLEKDGSYLCVSLSGTPTIRQAEHTRTLAPDRLHVLRQPHGGGDRQIEFESTVALAVLAFFPARWSLACPHGPTCKVGRFLLHGADRAPGDQTLDLDERGTAIARHLLAAHNDEDDDLLAIEQSALALLSWAFAQSATPRVQPASPLALHPQAALKVRQAAELLRTRMDDPPTISELSRSVRLNESDLKRCFKCVYGESIASYSRHKRLDAARDLLTHSGLGIAAIALEVGFTNPSQFARAFRRQFGRNPAEYRRSPP